MNALMGRFDGGASAALRGFVESVSLAGISKAFQVSYERTQVHRDMTRMDTDDEIVKFALDSIASRTVGKEDPTLDAFDLTIQARQRSDGSQATEAQVRAAQFEIDSLIDRLDLRYLCWHIVRSGVKWGNEFREIGIDDMTQDIVRFEQRPEHTMWPNKDARGSRVPGYVQRPEQMPDRSAEISFKEWEIVHFTFGELDDYLGTPLFKAARRNWKRLNLAEDSTSLARLIRAFMKLVHKVPVNADWSIESKQKAIERYKNNMAQRKLFDSDNASVELENNAFSVSTDVYIPDDGSKRGGVEMLDPENAQLQNMNDVNHFLDRLITASTIPKRQFPFEGSTPKLSEGGGNSEDKHFACTLKLCQTLLKRGFKKLFDVQLILKGLDPRDFNYVMRMAEINVTDQLRFAQTQAASVKAMDILLKQYPELAEHLDVMLREYTSMADASLSKLKDVTVEKRQYTGNTNAGNDNRTQLPGAGNSEAREKV